MFIAALSMTAKMWKQSKGPSTDEWINKMWSVHTMGYHSPLEKKEILQHAEFCNVEIAEFEILQC